MEYKVLEETLHNTLVMAQSTADEVKNVAQKQADQVLADAKATAQQIVKDAEEKIKSKQKDLENLKKQVDIYKAKMESLLISQLELLKDAKDD